MTIKKDILEYVDFVIGIMEKDIKEQEKENKMTRIYGLLIFHINEIETKLFMKIGERDNYIKQFNLTPSNYRMFHYEVEKSIADLDEDYTNNYF